MIPDAIAATGRDLLVGLGAAVLFAFVVYLVAKEERRNESLEITVHNTRQPEWAWPPRPGGHERIGSYSPRRTR